MNNEHRTIEPQKNEVGHFEIRYCLFDIGYSHRHTDAKPQVLRLMIFVENLVRH